MTIEHLNIKLKFEPYSKRVRTIFGWTFLLYFIITAVIAFNTDLNGLLLCLTFLSALFILDYSRRLRWVKSVIDSLETNSSGILLKYYEKDIHISTTISWDNLKIITGTTFTKNVKKYISIKKNTENIGSFYADINFDNNEVDRIYRKLIELKSANT